MSDEDLIIDAKGLDEVLEKYKQADQKSTYYPEDILKECPKFRILVIGQTGAGKSTLCSKVFGVDVDTTAKKIGINISAHGQGTKAKDVHKEITFTGQNDHIILHDSGGFEAASEDTFTEVEKFIKGRRDKTKLADQLHCIWYCIPLTGHRQVQASEKKFFREVDVGDIPVIAIFTHFDEVEEHHEMILIRQHQRLFLKLPLPASISEDAHARAVRDYDEVYRPGLEEVTGRRSKIAVRRVSMPKDYPEQHQGTDEVVKTTFEMLTKDGSLRLLWTAAQQQDSELKRHGSIDTVMKYLGSITFTNSLPFALFLGGAYFTSSFNEMYGIVSSSWRLIDPKDLLRTRATRNKFFEACLKLTTFGRISVQTGMMLNFLGPVTAPFITIALLKTAAGLIMMHEDLFWLQRAESGLQITTDSLNKVASDFARSKGREIAAAYLNSRIEVTNYASKAHCKDVLETAIRLAREEEVFQKKKEHRFFKH